MVLMTMVARITDGLPLAASLQEDDELGKSVVEYQSQAKRLFRTLTKTSPSKCSIESGPFMFHYIIEQDVCFLTLCDRNFSRKNAYGFLSDIAQQLFDQYGHKVNTASRPYSFIEFDTYMQKAKRVYISGNQQRNVKTLNFELQDVQRIMVQNINDVLQRGAVLDDLDSKAQTLSIHSGRFKKDAASLNVVAWMAYGLGASIVFFLLFFWVRFLM